MLSIDQQQRSVKSPFVELTPTLSPPGETISEHSSYSMGISSSSSEEVPNFLTGLRSPSLSPSGLNALNSQTPRALSRITPSPVPSLNLSATSELPSSALAAEGFGETVLKQVSLSVLDFLAASSLSLGELSMAGVTSVNSAIVGDLAAVYQQTLPPETTLNFLTALETGSLESFSHVARCWLERALQLVEEQNIPLKNLYEITEKYLAKLLPRENTKLAERISKLKALSFSLIAEILGRRAVTGDVPLSEVLFLWSAKPLLNPELVAAYRYTLEGRSLELQKLIENDPGLAFLYGEKSVYSEILAKNLACALGKPVKGENFAVKQAYITSLRQELPANLNSKEVVTYVDKHLDIAKVLAYFKDQRLAAVALADAYVLNFDFMKIFNLYLFGKAAKLSPEALPLLTDIYLAAHISLLNTYIYALSNLELTRVIHHLSDTLVALLTIYEENLLPAYEQVAFTAAPVEPQFMSKVLAGLFFYQQGKSLLKDLAARNRDLNSNSLLAKFTARLKSEQQYGYLWSRRVSELAGQLKAKLSGDPPSSKPLKTVALTREERLKLLAAAELFASEQEKEEYLAKQRLTKLQTRMRLKASLISRQTPNPLISSPNIKSSAPRAKEYVSQITILPVAVVTMRSPFELQVELFKMLEQLNLKRAWQSQRLTSGPVKAKKGGEVKDEELILLFCDSQQVLTYIKSCLEANFLPSLKKLQTTLCQLEQAELTTKLDLVALSTYFKQEAEMSFVALETSVVFINEARKLWNTVRVLALAQIPAEIEESLEILAANPYWQALTFLWEIIEPLQDSLPQYPMALSLAEILEGAQSKVEKIVAHRQQRVEQLERIRVQIIASQRAGTYIPPTKAKPAGEDLQSRRLKAEQYRRDALELSQILRAQTEILEEREQVAGSLTKEVRAAEGEMIEDLLFSHQPYKILQEIEDAQEVVLKESRAWQTLLTPLKVLEGDKLQSLNAQLQLLRDLPTYLTPGERQLLAK